MPLTQGKLCGFRAGDTIIPILHNRTRSLSILDAFPAPASTAIDALPQAAHFRP